MIQGFFAIIPGTILVYFLTSMFALYYFADLPEEIRLQVSSIFAGMAGIGYILGNLVLSRLGDYLFKKNKKNRTRLATFCLIITIPLFLITLFLVEPVSVNKLDIDYPDPIPTGEMWHYIILTIGEIFRVYPSYIFYFIFAIIGTMTGAGPVANRNATMIDVNMPEHKGTAASFFNLSEQIGKGVTLLISFMLITWLGSIYNMMLFSIIFWIPAAILWYFVTRNVEEDMYYKSRILTERKQVTLIDYIFELEIQMDRAIQKVQDSKYYIETNKEKFNQLLNDSLKIIIFCEREGVSRSITNIESKAHVLKLKVILTKQEANSIYKKLEDKNLSVKEIDNLNEGLRKIKLKISEWEQSTFGEIQTYYEDAYLKIVEARLLRHINLVRCVGKIKEAINIYHRTKHLLSERIEITKDKEDLTEEDSIMFEKEQDIYEKCRKSLLATVKLRDDIESVFQQLEDAGISKGDLLKIVELTFEYEVDLYNIIVDTLGVDNKTKDAIMKILKKIDISFNEYDQWIVDFQVF